ncbi:MAG: hypothetical protein PVG07_12885 [Acidobacteriota bacterium]|jgi:hypothetical protein
MRLQRFAIIALCSALPLVLLGLAACGSDEPDQPDVVKPITSQGDSAGDGMSPPAAGNGQLDIELPESWVEEPPANTMRLLQASIPGGEGEDAEFALFYFGPGGGGGVEANIQRWLGQVEPAEGTQPVRETFESGELTIHFVEAEGSITPSRMSMTAEPPQPRPGYMLLGAVVEGPGGPWFLKVTGPQSTLGPEREAFLEMVRNLRVRSEV